MYILSVAGLLMGCDDDVATGQAGAGDIIFGVSDVWQEATRSLVTSATDLQTKPFVVLGKYSAGDAYDAANLQTVFDNQEVSYNSSDGWNYQPIQRWERSSTYRFCAFWPKTDGARLSGDLNSTIVLKDFQGNLTSNDHIDLLVADVVEQVVDDPRAMSEATGNMVHDGITLSFHHVLCNIKVAVKKAATSDITVTGVHLLHTPNKGDLTLTKSGGDWTKSWTVDTDEEEQVDYYSGKVSVDLTDAYTTIWDEGFIVIPQTVNTDPAADENSKVIIRVDFTSDKSGTLQQKSFDIAVPSTPAWQINKKILYQLTIDENDYIMFGTPVVESWGTSQASGTIIIK